MEPPARERLEQGQLQVLVAPARGLVNLDKAGEDPREPIWALTEALVDRRWTSAGAGLAVKAGPPRTADKRALNFPSDVRDSL